MKLHSTKNSHQLVSFKEAIFNCLPLDNGLYVPSYIPKLSDDFIKNIANYSLVEMAQEISFTLIGDDIPKTQLNKIVETAIDFPLPIVHIHDNIYSLELYHGPTLAFKDFGARFTAQVMSYFLNIEQKQITILVATSGDTGSAVANGFLGLDGITVIILYPSGKISQIQEQQLTTLSNNIIALEVKGTFDDCQKMVKSAFLDSELSQKLNLASANSINISRLIPQSFYYFYAYSKLSNNNVVVSVPSGNFGNLCAGILAKKMGLPINLFLAATNINDIIPQYLTTGIFNPRPSKQTIANAMDVGNPSNYARLKYFYDDNISKIRDDLKGYRYTDDEIRIAITQVYNKHRYILDPHGAIAYLALLDYNKIAKHPYNGIFLETAHPAKFKDQVDGVLGLDIEIPNSLTQVIKKQKHSIVLNPNFAELKTLLIDITET
ncbi:MAG: threonine synthase [Burkholderiales bacterium]|nr:threonine synthase [Burkholderiales bacterium]